MKNIMTFIDKETKTVYVAACDENNNIHLVKDNAGTSIYRESAINELGEKLFLNTHGKNAKILN